MRIPHAFLSLPPSLLLLLAAQLHAQTDSRDEQDGQLQQTLPTAVRKMSPDEGEKFMPEYYAFAPADFYGGNLQTPLQLLARGVDFAVLTPEEEALLATNSSAALVFRPPFPRHYDHRARSPEGRRKSDSRSLYRRTVEVLARLRSREFTCPAGTHVCSNIDEPDYCCTDGTTCFVVENAPDAGNVGCCPDGQTCGGSVASCDDGNTACPAEEGGGCCIPGCPIHNLGNTPDDNDRNTHADEQQHYHHHHHIDHLNTIYDIDATDDDIDIDIDIDLRHQLFRQRHRARTPSTTIITHGATIVVPLTDAQAAPTTTATCAGGWFLCGAGAGPVAGCCPSGYVCGTASCTLSATTATATVQKELPGNDAAGGWRGMRGQGGVLLACLVALGWAL
ncbi:hypothetical protein CHU98_g6496 [Xylaria longipes]|nr:hypothetical protein CHU98_g6496 [Xylaria longipes]